MRTLFIQGPTLFDDLETIGMPDVETDVDGLAQDPELRARFLGMERAGVPGWSKSIHIVGAALAALLQSETDPNKRAHLARIEQQAYEAARRRKAALRAMEAEEGMQ